MQVRSSVRRPRLGSALAVAAALALLLPLSTPATAAPSTDAAAAGSGHSRAVWDFERDAVGAVPAGCSTPAGKAALSVTDQQAYHSRHSLELNDDSASSLPTIACERPAQQGAQLTLRANPVAVTNGFMIDLTGTTTVRTGVVFHLLVRADGRIDWYDGGRWLPVAPAGAVPQHAWSEIGLGTTAEQDMVYVSVNGHTVGSAGPWGVDPVTAVTGFQLAGYGTASVADRVLFDNVWFTHALRKPPAEVKRQFRFGDQHTIATSSTPVQMPNTAVRIPLAHHRERILASYPAHTDAAQTAGNEMVYSDDGGKTWVDYQSHNPMPDAPSYFITRLANGNLYALNYHGYAAADPKQSVLESAVSTDDGATWTVRDGLLAAPAALAPYACERPAGCTAIVQVHNVIEDPDGTLYQSAYGKYDGDPKYRQLMLISHDGGLNWAVQATVAFDPNLSTNAAYEGPCEGVFVRTGPHSFLVVMRTGSYLPMYSARSDDDGKTWTAPEQMKTTTGQPVSSVFPAMERLGDGSLLLMVGRPGLALLRSYDNGARWSDPTWVDYTNSANGYMLAMGGRSVMVFGDRGANWQSPHEYGVWDRMVTAVGRGH